MIWFFIALIAPFLYATTNYIDKTLLEKYFKEGGVGTLVLFSSLVAVFILPFLYLADNAVLEMSFDKILTLSLVGLLNVIVLWCYLIALRDEEASIVVVFYQLVPVIGAILGYFILDEVLTAIQIIAMAIIILGTTIISFEVDAENRFKLRKKTIIPMLVAAFLWAVESVLFKAVAIEESVWVSLFWEHLALTVVGVLVFVFIKSYRESFIYSIKQNSKKILSLNIFNEFIYITGNVIVGYTYLLAPVGLVLLTESFQPIFVLVIGLFLTIFFPRIATEKIHTRHILQKVVAILITGIGTYLLLIY